MKVPPSAARHCLLSLLVFLGVSWNAYATEIIKLSEGHFYWNKYLTPADVAEPATGSPIPLGLWLDTIPEVQRNKGRGAGAYRIPLPPLPRGLYEIRLNAMMTAVEAWLVPVDKPEFSLPMTIGKVAKPGQEEVPLMMKPRIFTFQIDDVNQRWELIINISNSTRFRSGVWLPPEIAKAPYFSVEDKQQKILTFSATGAMIIMLLYQTMIFLRRRDDWGAFFLAGICFSIILRNVGIDILISEWIQDPQNSWLHDVSIKMEYIPVATAPFCSLCFLITTFRKVRYRAIFLHAAAVGCIVLVGLALMAKPRILEQLLFAFQFYCFTVVILCLVFIAKAVRLSEKGSYYTLIGMLIPLMLAILELYLFMIGKGFNITTFGAVIFVFMQSQVLAQRFAIAFKKAEHLSRDLKKEVEQQTWQIGHIMRHVPQGIGTISRNLHLAPVHSDSMRRFFPNKQLETLRFDQLICNDMQVDEHTRSIFPATLETIVGESTLSWNLNSHLLLQEARTQDNRDLAFEWNPIVKNGVVEEVLVTVRDISELKELRQKNQVLDREFEYFLAFSKMSRTHVLHTYHNLTRLLDECFVIARDPVKDSKWSRRVLILLHTMKGNARQTGLKSLAGSLHREEQAFIELQSASSELTAHKVNEILERIQAHLDSIKTVIDRIYGHESEASTEAGLEEILRQQFQALWMQQRKSEDDRAELTLEGPVHLITSPLKEAFLDIWGHLLTNSFDHGLVNDRPGFPANAQPRLRITLRIEVVQGHINLAYSDSGRGLNLRRIREKALKNGLITEGKDMSPTEIGALIFASGFSTREKVSQSSGRGIGMDAVKTIMEDIGASVQLEVDPHSESMGYHPFVLKIEAPRSHELSHAGGF